MIGSQRLKVPIDVERVDETGKLKRGVVSTISKVTQQIIDKLELVAACAESLTEFRRELEEKFDAQKWTRRGTLAATTLVGNLVFAQDAFRGHRVTLVAVFTGLMFVLFITFEFTNWIRNKSLELDKIAPLHSESVIVKNEIQALLGKLMAPVIDPSTHLQEAEDTATPEAAAVEEKQEEADMTNPENDEEKAETSHCPMITVVNCS